MAMVPAQRPKALSPGGRRAMGAPGDIPRRSPPAAKHPPLCLRLCCPGGFYTHLPGGKKTPQTRCKRNEVRGLPARRGAGAEHRPHRGSSRTMSCSLGTYAAQKTAGRNRGPYFLFISFFFFFFREEVKPVHAGGGRLIAATALLPAGPGLLALTPCPPLPWGC